MHKFMRAIGFSKISNRKELKALLASVVMNAGKRAYTISDEEVLFRRIQQGFR